MAWNIGSFCAIELPVDLPVAGKALLALPIKIRRTTFRANLDPFGRFAGPLPLTTLAIHHSYPVVYHRVYRHLVCHVI